jgi:hypothetical protein
MFVFLEVMYIEWIKSALEVPILQYHLAFRSPMRDSDRL